MVKNNSKFSKTRKSIIAALCAVTVTCTGLAAACSNGGTDNSDESSSFKREDTVQVLKNGTFENYSVPKDAVYLIKNTDGWSRSGDSSNAMSGIIGTSAKAWAALTDDGLYNKLQYNNDLDPDDEDYEDNYVDYNGMKTRDMLYRDTYSALLENKDNKLEDSFIFTKHKGFENYFGFTEQDGEFYYLGRKVAQKEDDENDKDYYFVNKDGSLGESVRLALIKNPGTHYNIQEDESDGSLYFIGEDGEHVKVYEDEESGDYYRLKAETADEGDDNKEFISNVLMVHNYPTDSKYNGIQQYYSSQTITLKANTAAEISLWVKTAELRFDKGFSQLNDQDRGAFIEVTQNVNGSSVSSFKIKSINTEKIIADKENGFISFADDIVSNGWLRYTIYVNACDFGDSTITINLGLGQSGKNSSDYSEKCTGYAFFDDVTVTKYRSLDDENCTYSDSASKITAAKTQCTLVSDDKDKIFIADRALSDRNMTDYDDKKRNSEDYYYLIDLASANGDISETYSAVNFTSLNTTVKFTTEEDEKTHITYYSANKFTGTSDDVSTDFTAEYTLPDKVPARNTANDLIGAYTVKDGFEFDNANWAKELNKKLLGDNGLTGLPKYDENTTANNMLLLASSNGAAYTAAIAADKFNVAAGKYMIVSFWVKTSDMNGKTAATIRISDGTEDNEQFITVDSTGKTTDFDENDKDIYNGWVQCFFFVENDTDDNKTFTIDFSFGNMSFAATTPTSYKGGWAALANMQTLSFNSESVYSLSSTGDYSQKFAFTEDDEEDNKTPFDTPSGTSNIKEGIATPSNYDGVNGGSSAVSQNDYRANYDEKNTNDLAGLINRDDFGNYENKTYILSMFNATTWSDAFEKDGFVHYQPLIIINTLRVYADNASANENTYTSYYIESSTGDVEIDGKKYRLATKEDGYDADTTYYSIGTNYGFVGADTSVSANSYKTISVKVMVSQGAVAYVYLVDGKTREVLGYTTPEYTFHYDDEGNVLDTKFKEDWTDSQHKGHVKYTLQNNGLYKDEDGVIRANFYNLTKAYKYIEFQGKTFYTEDGETVSYQKLENKKFEDETYYYDQAGTVEADHYLVNSDNVRVYRFKNGKYYYMVNGEVSSQVVENFDAESLAVKDVKIDEEYAVMVENPDGALNGKWVTVSFFIHTGSEDKDYRLELWSGKRDEAGTLTAASGAVAFDYSYENIESEDDFKVREDIEKDIILAYKGLLKDYPDKLKNENIAYYEKEVKELVKDGTLTEAEVKAAVGEYTAHYYTYTLYDDDTYIPFNAEVAKDGETGYDYKITDEEYSERLAYLEYSDETSHSVYIDYSAVDQNVTIGTTSDDEEGDSESPETDWLIITSIILVVVLLFALASIVARDVIKRIRKKRGVKSQSKNMYRKRERYIKKLHLVKNEEQPAEDEPESGEPSEEAPAEEPTEVVTSEEESPEEESPVETAEPAKEDETPKEE